MKRALTAVAAGAIVALALPAMPAIADHGYQTYKFTNNTEKKVYDIHIFFDEPLSHIGDVEPTWPGADCNLSGDRKTLVTCKSGTRLSPGESFRLSVATPPAADGSYVKDSIWKWWWTDRDHDQVGRTRTGCGGGCKDLGVQP